MRWRAGVFDMMVVRNAVRTVFQTQLDEEPDEIVTRARKILNDVYDVFVAQCGPLSSRETVTAFAVSLNETGCVDWSRMEQITGRGAKSDKK
jgi:hypothetical protein